MPGTTITSARRRKPKTTVGIRCVSVFFLFMAFTLATVIFLISTGFGGAYSQTELRALVTNSIAFIVLLVAVSVGLLQHRRYARWAAVATSLYIAVGGSVVGIVLFMYLIRPELDERFV